MTTTQSRKTKARRAQQRQRERRRRMVLTSVVVVVAVVAVAGLVWWAAGRQPGSQAGQAVERFMHVHGLAVAPWSPDAVYVATHEGLTRLDGDGQWRYISEQPHDFMGFSANPTDDGAFYSSGHPAPGTDLGNPVGFMVSSDGGATWSQRSLQEQVDFHAMTVAPSDGDVVYGWNGAGQAGLYVSADGGNSWETISGGMLEQAGGALSLAVRPGIPDEVWAGTQTGLLASRDGGRSWETVLPGAVTAVAFDPADPDRVVAYAADGDGLVESRDGGQSWSDLGLAIDGDAVGHIAVHPEDPQTLYVGTYGEGLQRTTDGGASWETMAESGVPQH
jgi:photosystem II stability/assembly factor-like uncharacterized protein